MRLHAALLLALAATACGSSSANTSGGDGNASGGGGDSGADAASASGISQQVVWPLSYQASVLGNNLQIAVENMYGYTTPGITPIGDVAALAKTVDDTLEAISKSVCASDPKAADAAASSQAIQSFIQSLPAGGGSSSMLQAQESKVEQLSAALRTALTASSCITGLTPPNGSANHDGGQDLSSAVAITGTGPTSVPIPVKATQAAPAIAIANTGEDSLTIGSITLDYVDGSTRSIGFGSSPGDGSSVSAPLSTTLAAGLSLVVDVDERTIKTVTLVGAALACPLPPGGGGGGAPCNGSVKIVGLAKGNGLLP